MDQYSFRCGVIDAFNEIVHAGVKRIAFSHATQNLDYFKHDLEYSKIACSKYATKYYVENDMLTTDLFNKRSTLNHHVIIYYTNDEDLNQYLNLKKEKLHLLENKEYSGQKRFIIAFKLGQLLCYSDNAIKQMIEENDDLEI